MTLRWAVKSPLLTGWLSSEILRFVLTLLLRALTLLTVTERYV